jgi:hypothetical protein
MLRRLNSSKNRGLTFPALPFIISIMLMNALTVLLVTVAVVVADGHAAGTCRA